MVGSSADPTLTADTFQAFKTVDKAFRLDRSAKPSRRGRGEEGNAGSLPAYVDFRDVRTWSVTGKPVLTLGDSSRVLSFEARPGLYAIPGGLTAAEQQQLARDALLTFPDPPATTNLKAHYGWLPQGLWQAAQLGLYLHGKVLNSASTQSAAALHPRPAQRQQTPTGATSRERLASCVQTTSNTQNLQAEQQHCTDASLQQCGTRSHAGGAMPEPSFVEFSGNSHNRPPHRTKALAEHCQHCWQREQCWSHQPSGLSAQTLFSKLRWATLGLPYDWTERQYNYCAEQRPVPPYLSDLFVRMIECAQVAAHAHQHRALGLTAEQHAVEGHRRPSNAPALPDAAIVNYYSKGDTLGGHKDDVEEDLTQPLVSISIGCAAVFLMGGQSKDVAPIPILLRSGDVLILSGDARTCYHGMPRILNDQGPGDVLAPSSFPPELAAVAEHFECHRVNVTLRLAGKC